MADNKEALPVVAWQERQRGRAGWTAWYDHGRMRGLNEPRAAGLYEFRPLTDHATATAAIAELRAEVERLNVVLEAMKLESRHVMRQARDYYSRGPKIGSVIYMGGNKIAYPLEIISTHSEGEYMAIYVSEPPDTARAGASGEATENKPYQPHESNPA